jgi:hypothetical protein
VAARRRGVRRDKLVASGRDTWSAAEAACRRGWTAGDKFLVGCLVVLLVLAAIIVIIGVAAS